jgi:hypothetical protein
VLLQGAGGFGDIVLAQLSVTPTDERTCVTETCSVFLLRISFHSVSLDQHETIRLSPQLGCVPGLLLSSSGAITLCAPHRPSSRAVPGLLLGACPHAHTQPLPTSRNRHALLLSYLTVSALNPLTRPALSRSLNASPPLLFQVFAPKNSSRWCHVPPAELSSSVL